MIDSIMILAQNIRYLRKIHGISQMELAVAIGASHPRISEIECGKANPTLDTIEKLARYFNVPPCKLLEDQKKTLGKSA